MFLTVDLNPYIEKKINVGAIHMNSDVKVKDSTYCIGMESIVSTVILNMFNEDSFLTGFLGGLNGSYYHNELSELAIPHDFINIKEETRTEIKLKDSRNYIHIHEDGPRITRDEVGNFYELYSKLLDKSSIVYALSDKLAQGVPEEIYFNLIKLAKDKNKRLILNAKSEELKRGVEAVPYMVILDKEDLEDLVNLKLDFQNEIIKASNYLLHRGIEFVVINISNDETLVLGQKLGYRVEIKDGTNLEYISKKKGSYGIASGFGVAINRKYDVDMTLRLIQAIKSAANVNEDIRRTELSQIKMIMNEVEITSINYY